MAEDVTELQTRVRDLESKVGALGLINLHLLLVLEITIRGSSLDKPIVLGEEQPALASELLDQMWSDVWKKVIGRDD